MKNQTVFYTKPIGIRETASIVGPKEAEGPLRQYFGAIMKDDILGQKSHEKAEIKMHISAIKNLLNKSALSEKDIDCVFAGDLLDEITGSCFTMREFKVPFMGQYNACATFGEALIVGSTMLEAGLMQRVICSTSSHFSTAERQYRYPLELGSQRTPLAQWTVTGAGSTMLESNEKHTVKITCATIGKVVDYGITDANDMGSAMLPAAMDTLINHFRDTGRAPSYYDGIFTGDLGHAGSRLLKKLIKSEGFSLDENYEDCGVLIFNREAQDVGQGASGAACSSVVFNSYIYSQMLLGKMKRVLLAPTGALISKITPLQGESIPGICHAVAMEVV